MKIRPMLAELFFCCRTEGQKDSAVLTTARTSCFVPANQLARAEGRFTSAIRAIPAPSGHSTDLNQLTVPKNPPRTPQIQLNPNILFTGSDRNGLLLQHLFANLNKSICSALTIDFLPHGQPTALLP